MWSGPPVLSVFTMSNSRRFALPAVVAMIAAAVASRALHSFLLARMQCGVAAPLARPPRISPGLRSSRLPSPEREGAERREALVRIAAPLVPHDAGHRDA